VRPSDTTASARRTGPARGGPSLTLIGNLLRPDLALRGPNAWPKSSVPEGKQNGQPALSLVGSPVVLGSRCHAKTPVRGLPEAVAAQRIRQIRICGVTSKGRPFHQTDQLSGPSPDTVRSHSSWLPQSVWHLTDLPPWAQLVASPLVVSMPLAPSRPRMTARWTPRSCSCRRGPIAAPTSLLATKRHSTSTTVSLRWLPARRGAESIRHCDAPSGWRGTQLCCAPASSMTLMDNWHYP
jgi:hypothetical protein